MTLAALRVGAGMPRSCVDYQRHKASFYRNLVGAFDVETAATAFFNHHAWAKLAVGVAVSVGDEDPLAHLARFAEVRRCRRQSTPCATAKS